MNRNQPMSWIWRWVVLFLSLFTMGCINICPFCPALKDGKHYAQQLTAADSSRVYDIAQCLQGWARATGRNPVARYDDVVASRLVVIGVGDPGVAGPTDFVAGRESGDTIYIVLRLLNTPTGIGIERHEIIHVVQEQHRELIVNGNIHYAPEFQACGAPLNIWVNL